MTIPPLKQVSLLVIFGIGLWLGFSQRLDLFIISALALSLAWYTEFGLRSYHFRPYYFVTITTCFIASLIFISLDIDRIVTQWLFTAAFVFLLGLFIVEDDDHKPKRRIKKAVKWLKDKISVPGVFSQPASTRRGF